MINRTEYRQIRWKAYCIYDASNGIYIANIEKIGEIAIINVLLYISQLNQNGVWMLAPQHFVVLSSESRHKTLFQYLLTSSYSNTEVKYPQI